MKKKILTKSQVRLRGIVAGILFTLLGLGWDYFQYKTLSWGTVIGNVIEGVVFAIFMIIFMNNYYKKRNKSQ